MNKLIPQIVYVKTTWKESTHVLTNVSNDTFSSLEEKPNQYTFSKEELIELLRETWEDGILTFISNVDKETAKTQFINNLLNQQ